MNIVCFPIVENRGLLSPVSPWLSAAPMFLLVDTETLAFRAIPNDPQRQKDRGCDPCEALGDADVDCVIVGEIEGKALGDIARRNVPVYGGAAGNAADALAAFIAGRLPLLREVTGASRPATVARP
jgi:predicted Fe-Mo cluster-binding NifX family protein